MTDMQYKMHICAKTSENSVIINKGKEQTTLKIRFRSDSYSAVRIV